MKGDIIRKKVPYKCPCGCGGIIKNLHADAESSSTFFTKKGKKAKVIKNCPKCKKKLG